MRKKDQFDEEKAMFSQANKTGGKINLERDGRDTILGKEKGAFSRN
jgi:hypothetical protein